MQSAGRPAGLYARAGRSAGQSRPVCWPEPAGLFAGVGVGRSLCRRRPVSMPASAGLYAGIGRSLCRRRPVSMPASAGLYAGVGRSLCRRRPVSMPASAGLYAGIYAGMGPRGLGPNPFLTVSQNSFFVSGLWASKSPETHFIKSTCRVNKKVFYISKIPKYRLETVLG